MSLKPMSPDMDTLQGAQPMTEKKANPLNGWRTAAIGVLVGCVITGIGSWAALSQAVVTKDDLSAAMTAHADHPHAEAVTRNEFNMLRDDIRDLKDAVNEMRTTLLKLHQP